MIDFTVNANRQMFYTTSGEGSPIVLLHGLAASHHEWDWLAPELVKSGFKVIRPDLMGHGDSFKPDSYDVYTTEFLYQVLLQWIDQIQIEIPFYLLGHSLGGYLSILLASQYQQYINKLILVSPLFSPQQLYPLARHTLDQPRFGEIVISLAKPNVVMSLLGMVRPFLGEYTEAARWQTAVDYARTAPLSMRFPATADDLTARLSQIDTDTLVVWGDSDLVLNPRFFPELVKALPHAKYFSFPNCGHEPHKMRYKKFNQLILQFLREPVNDGDPSLA